MVIDIDIKIADGNGKLLHRFEKCFEEGNNTSRNGAYLSDIGKSFEDFLAEYMSFSGRFIREKIMNNYHNMLYEQYNNTSHVNNTIETENEYDYNIDDAEMEYKIRIGSKKILIGKIPINKSKFTTDIGNNNNTINKQQTEIENNSIKKSKRNNSYYSNKFINDRNDINFSMNPIILKNKKHEIDNILSYAMTKAIEKYESNLSPIIEETNLEAIEPNEKIPC